MYPTAIVVLVHTRKSLWETAEVSQSVSIPNTGIQFARVTATTSTVVSDFSHYTGTTIAMTNLNKAEESGHEMRLGSSVV